jgi:hypothetical protein
LRLSRTVQLSLRRTGLSPPIYADRGDFTVIDAGREVGRIYEDPHASQPWFWSIIVIGARCWHQNERSRPDF